MMWCWACSVWWPGCVGGTSWGLSWWEAAVSPAGRVLCLQSWSDEQLPVTCLHLHAPFPNLTLSYLNGERELGQFTGNSLFWPVLLMYQYGLGAEVHSGLNPFLTLTLPVVWLQEQGKQATSVWHAKWSDSTSLGSCGWGCWSKHASTRRASCGGRRSHIGQVKGMQWLAVGDCVLRGCRGSYLETWGHCPPECQNCHQGSHLPHHCPTPLWLRSLMGRGSLGWLRWGHLVVLGQQLFTNQFRHMWSFHCVAAVPMHSGSVPHEKSTQGIGKREHTGQRWNKHSKERLVYESSRVRWALWLWEM